MRNTPTPTSLLMAAIATAGLVAGLAGCASTEENPTMTYDEALTELTNLVEPVQDLVGGEWRRLDGGAEDCSLPSGSTGAWSPAARLGPGIPLEQQQDVVDRVVQIWTNAGFEPVVAKRPPVDELTVTEVGYPAEGYGIDGLYLTFTISINSTSIEGQTRCVPGDSSQINQDYQDNLKKEQAEQNGGG